MDPSTQAFTPYSNGNEPWRLYSEFNRMQQIQSEHAERLARLERRQDDDARMKSVWGQSSPFPSVLSGTPQQAPLQHPPADPFRGFDDDTNNLISSLHLDPEEEPRRGMGAASRANSVRFDESANQNHFSHSSRPSVDLASRTSSAFGGVRMDERTASYKSEGRASSAHSMRSAASGRASSFNLDGNYSGDLSRSPLDTPAIAPGLLLLGTVPAIVRCWLSTNFKNDTLLYAAICTGSYRSTLDVRIIQKLGLENAIRTFPDGPDTIELPVYFTEAVPHPASSHSSSPAPQLPMITAEFQVVDWGTDDVSEKTVPLVLGSDLLRIHNADILFSSNIVVLVDDDRTKVSIPLVRPENESTFNTLRTWSGSQASLNKDANATSEGPPFLNGLGQSKSSTQASSAASMASVGKARSPGVVFADSSANTDTTVSDSENASLSRVSTRPSLQPLSTRSELEETLNAVESNTSSTRGPTNASGAASSTNWRREASVTSAGPTPNIGTAGLDWASASKNRAADTTYQRKDGGIKILKPKTAISRTVSSATTAPSSPSVAATASGAASPAENRSRFFDEGRRRSGGDSSALALSTSRLGLVAPLASTTTASPATAPPKTKSNPIGGASAFSWLNPASSGPKS